MASDGFDMKRVPSGQTPHGNSMRSISGLIDGDVISYIILEKF